MLRIVLYGVFTILIVFILNRIKYRIKPCYEFDIFILKLLVLALYFTYTVFKLIGMGV